MASDRTRVRSRRSSAGAELTIAVTGAARGVGRRLVEQLLPRAGVGTVVGIDSERGDLEGVQWRVVDVTEPALLDKLDGVDVVVHTDLDLSADRDTAQRTRHNVRGTQTVLTAAAAARVRLVVLLSSAMVYGATADNELPLAEDAALAATPDGSLVSDLLEIESLAARAPRSHGGLSVAVVRAAILVGPDIDTVLTRHFESPRLLTVRGTTPAWQFCHVDDAASALLAAALGEVTGAVTAGCEGWLSQAEVEALAGKTHVELPAAVAYGTAERLHRLGLTPAPASELHYLVHPWVVPSTTLRAAGWKPTYDNATAFQAMLEQSAGRHAVISRRIGRRETATLGAAGATVAVLGTAAIVRRARKRRRP